MLEMRVSTRAGRGQDTRIKLEDEQAQEQQKRKATPRRASNQAIPAIVRSPARRVLDLDLSDVPLSDDFKTSLSIQKTSANGTINSGLIISIHPKT